MSAAINYHKLGPLIWVLSHNEAKREAELLKAEAFRLLHLKRNPARTALIDALLSGMGALLKDADKAAHRAHDSGLMLYCWAGTKVLEGGAA